MISMAKEWTPSKSYELIGKEMNSLLNKLQTEYVPLKPVVQFLISSILHSIADYRLGEYETPRLIRGKLETLHSYTIGYVNWEYSDCREWATQVINWRDFGFNIELGEGK